MHNQKITEGFSLEHVVPYFQPIMDLEHEAVWCYECLARLITPGEFTFLPNQFLHLLERDQTTAKFTETIFHRSAEYFRDINVAWNINISTQDMNNPDLINMLGNYLHRYPNPSRVSLELTAAAALEDHDQFARFVDTCRDINIGVFIDHFGVTPENAEEIISLPINGIKIDGHLLRHLADHDDTRSFVKELASMAESRHIALIAERIEDEQTLAECRQLPVRYAQGFYFSTPKAKT